MTARPGRGTIKLGLLVCANTFQSDVALLIKYYMNDTGGTEGAKIMILYNHLPVSVCNTYHVTMYVNFFISIYRL